MADLIIKRLPDNVSKDELIKADLLCHYVSILDNLRWFPITYVYREREDGKFELFSRLISQRHFEKVKRLFNVNNVKELQEKLTAIKAGDKNSNRISYSSSFDSVTPIYDLVDIEKIGTIR